MGIMPGHPIEIFSRRLQPAAVLAHPVLATDDMVVRCHSRSERLVEPHLLFLPGLVDVTPAGRAGGPRPRHVGGHLALLDSVADPALQRAPPDRRIVSAAPLVVALEPFADLAELYQVGRAAYTAAEVGEIEIGRLLFFGDGIVQLPQIDGAFVEFVPIVHRPRLWQVLALFAIAGRQRPPEAATRW